MRCAKKHTLQRERSKENTMSRIEIIDPTGEWKAEYVSYASAIRSVIGDLAVRIDHIGSTSVEGLPAKDIIDIQMTVSHLEDPSIIALLTKVGYVYRREMTHDNLVGVEATSPELRKVYFEEPPGERRMHLHIRELGRLNQRYPLVFRDFLRSNVRVRQAYAAIKRELAARFPNDVNAYYAIKDPYMDTIYEAALVWATSSNWRPDTEFL